MANMVAILLGILKFWDQVTWLIKELQGTPEEQREKKIAAIRAASQKAMDTKGDTSGYEKVIRN